MIISSKKKFYEMQKLGIFNTPRYWDALDSVDTNGTITARNIIAPGSKTYYCLSLMKMKNIFRTIDPNGYTFLEDPPNNKILQGEFTRLDGSYYLKYNRNSGTLGETLLMNHIIVKGIVALAIMRDCVDDSSLEDMMVISDMFGDDHNVDTPVIEFSTYPIPVGQIKGRNTIIWEVRSY